MATAAGAPPPDDGLPVSATGTDNHFGSIPAINVVKLTNGTDNNTGPGAFVPVGSTVTFTYVVTNTGNVPLSGVAVLDNNGSPANAADDFNASFAGGDTNANGLLDLSETWTFAASRIATPGQYTNIGTATGTPPPGSGAPVTDSDPDNHFGSIPAINVVKLTNGTDNNAAPGPFLPIGSTVTFNYVVTNPGNVPLSGVTVVDNNGTPANPADDFNPAFTGGDTNANGLLDLSETWAFIAARIVTPGQYTNLATTLGTPPPGAGAPVNDTDADNHFGGVPAINVVKLTNGTDNNSAPGPFVPVGSSVTFTYVVTNPGDVPLSGVTVQDNNGTPVNPTDDFNATFGGGDTNGNGFLDLLETWTFSASRIATPGQYSNIATAIGTPTPGGSPVSDTDTDNHFGTNQPPNDIAGGPLSVNENSTFGTLVGIVTGQDPNGDTLTYDLTDNAGGRFALNNSGQVTVANGVLLDFEQNASHAIGVRVTVSGGLSFNKTFTVAVNDLNPETAIGDGGDNTLFGDFADDTINGQGGNDVLRGGGGNDYITSGGGQDTALGEAGNDTVIGADGADYLNGGADNDLIVGNDGNDTLLGDTGNDYLDGGIGNDLLMGGIGNDTVLGGDGADYVNGGEGDDHVFGGDGADILIGDTGNDYLNGENGDDIVFGGVGNDTVLGADGNDYLSAGPGDDNLVGGLGNDTLFAGSGSDYLQGDAGNDIFVFDAQFETSSVIDFTSGAGVGDVIQFNGGVFTDFANLLAHAVQNGTNTVITSDGGDTLTLANVVRASLVSDDFVFA